MLRVPGVRLSAAFPRKLLPSAVREELFSCLRGEQEVPGVQNQFGRGYLWLFQQLELCYTDFIILQSDLCKGVECLIAATQQVCAEVVLVFQKWEIPHTL